MVPEVGTDVEQLAEQQPDRPEGLPPAETTGRRVPACAAAIDNPALTTLLAA